MNANANAQAAAARAAAIINEGPPPTNHTLKPHHLQILRVLQVLYRKHDEKLFPPAFMLHIHRVLMLEVSEVRQPANYTQLMTAIDEGAKATTDLSNQALTEIKDWRKSLDRPESLVEFFKDVKLLAPATSEDDEESFKFTRRSLFGYFVRRCNVSFLKLSFEAIEALWRDYFLWVDGEINEVSITIRKDLLTNAYNIFKTQADKKEYAEPEPYALWEHGLAVGDEMVATENLRKFFEQHFHEQNDSGVRQHALLNLARMHFLRHQYVACRKLLQEAITTARTNNDKYTLQHCIGLLNRLPPVERGRKAAINEVQPDLHPMEVLYDAKKLLTVSYEQQQQPLLATFEKIIEAATLYDYWSEFQRDAVTEDEQWGQHAVQSVAWSMMGNPQLANVEENIVIAFTESGGPDNTRLTVILNNAYRQARQGKYQEAISFLLHPSIWQGLTITDYQLWANEIWQILVLRASRRGQLAMYEKYLRPKRPDGMYGPRSYWFNSSVPLNSTIRDPLYEVISLREVNQAHTALEPLLTAIWQAEFLQRFDLYRVALLLLADVSLGFGMTIWSHRIVEEILPQVLNGDEIETRALACVTLARCLIALPVSDVTKTRADCVKYLAIAEEDYKTLEMYSRLQDVQYLTSAMYENMEQRQERDDYAARCLETERLQAKVAAEVLEDWVTEAWELVADVGSALAARRSS